MKQGTVSVLFGCHSQIHSMFVVLAWIKLYHRLPNWWQLSCILIHDIGHWGKNYLDDIEVKQQHWILGATIARKLFGEKGWLFVAGHDRYSGYPESELLKPDKYSWIIAPRLWIVTNLLFEPKMRQNGMGRWEHADYFKKEVKRNIESGDYASAHDIYMRQDNAN